MKNKQWFVSREICYGWSMKCKISPFLFVGSLSGHAVTGLLYSFLIRPERGSHKPMDFGVGTSSKLPRIKLDKSQRIWKFFWSKVDHWYSSQQIFLGNSFWFVWKRMHLHPSLYAILRALICKKMSSSRKKKTSVDIGKNHMPVQISKFLDFNIEKLSHQLRMTVLWTSSCMLLWTLFYIQE